jgi:hypothetical protein
MGAEKQKPIKSIKPVPIKSAIKSAPIKSDLIKKKPVPLSKKQRVIDLIKGNKLSISALLTQLKNANIMSKNVTEQELINCTILANYYAADPSSPSGKGIKELLNIKSTLRDILENLTPDEQCKLHMDDYFDTGLRTQVLKAVSAKLESLPDNSNYKQFIYQKYNLKLTETQLDAWVKNRYGTFEELSRLINQEIKTYVNTMLPIVLKINIGLPSGGTNTIIFKVCDDRELLDPSQFSEYYNSSLALYGIYNKPTSYTFKTGKYDFNLGECWLCGTPIAIFIGFGTLVKHKPKSTNYDLICTGLGECEHVFPVIDAAKLGALSDRHVAGAIGEYYPSHTHCNQVKNDAQLWYKNLQSKSINPAEPKIHKLLIAIKDKALNGSEKNEHLHTLIDRKHNSVNADWINNIMLILQNTINSMAATVPNFKIIANTIDKSIEAAECLLNMIEYISYVKLLKEQAGGRGGGRGGGTSIEDDKVEIKKVLEDPNNMLISQIKYDTIIDNSTELNVLNNIFNKLILLDIGRDIIIEYIKTDITQPSINIQDIIDIFVREYYGPITEYVVNIETNSYKIMEKIIVNKGATDDAEMNGLLVQLQNDNPNLININIETISEAITNINLDLVNTILASIIVKLSSYLVIINNYIVYITNANDIRNYDETKYVEIIDKHFIYNGISYDVQDAALCKVLIDGKNIIPLVLTTELAELRKKEIDNVINVLDKYNQIADISRNTVSDPTMITDAIKEQETDIKESITELEPINPPLAKELGEGLSFLLENFNIDYEGPIQKSSSERLETTLESNVATGVTSKQRTLTLEQIQNYIKNNKQKFLEVCNVNFPVELDNNGNICQNINGEQIKINSALIMNIIKKDLCREYSTINYDPKRNRLNCSNSNNIGGTTRKKYNNSLTRKKKIKNNKKNINIRRRTKNRLIKHKKLTRRRH